MSAEAEFVEAIRDTGLSPPDSIIPDGKIRRFASNGQRGDDAGWYVFHEDGIPAGSWGCWRTGETHSWRARLNRPLSPVEAAALTARMAETERQREEEKQQQQATAAKKAQELMASGSSDLSGHPYFSRKRVPLGSLVRRGRWEQRGWPDALLLPLYDTSGAIVSVEAISADGTKDFLAGGRKRGCFHPLGRIRAAERIAIGEGLATVAAAVDASGWPGVVAMDAGNLEPVARAVREIAPDADIVLLADHDPKPDGANRGLEAATLAARAINARVARCSDGDKATDFWDLWAERAAEAVIAALSAAALPDTSTPVPSASSAPETILATRQWPAQLDNAAFHGLVGEFVRAVEPNTESDPAALLVQTLLAFGAFVGRGPHYLVERDEHHANLFATIVGESSKARKGTSAGRIRKMFERIPDWKPHVSGLSSGEGVKYHVRDPREESKTDKDGVVTIDVVDQGVADKRLLVFESEFAGVLRACQRQGNTLSATIREAWDSGNLRSLTKNDPVTATGAHIAIVGHITSDELRAELTQTDAANGFANRFLFVAAKRSKLLPFGGDDLGDEVESGFATRFAEVAQLARTRRRITMASGARTIWEAVYPTLSAGGDGLHGCVTGRAEAQVIRLGLIYALVDGAEQIDVPHLLAALAVWQYCDATARYVFGASVGDRIADEIMQHLRRAASSGMSRSEIRDAFGRNQSADRIGAALDLLAQKGYAKSETVQTGGRPSELWRAIR
jgi:phage/plasmid primase-like uncharacterized protein